MFIFAAIILSYSFKVSTFYRICLGSLSRTASIDVGEHHQLAVNKAIDPQKDEIRTPFFEKKSQVYPTIHTATTPPMQNLILYPEVNNQKTRGGSSNVAIEKKVEQALSMREPTPYSDAERAVGRSVQQAGIRSENTANKAMQAILSTPCQAAPFGSSYRPCSPHHRCQ